MLLQPVHWQDHTLTIIDQTLLPAEFKEIELATVAQVWEAIKTLRVRGAPAIGVAAAYGLLVAIKEANPPNARLMQETLRNAAGYLATSRPTAVNLFWALERMKRTATEWNGGDDARGLWNRLEAEAIEIHQEDIRRCKAIGAHGASLIAGGSGVLTHCNAGSLATGAYGTALAIMYAAHEAGVRFRVYADETRPLLQGARLTAWELVQAGIDVTLICDNMAAQVMREGKVQLVVTGADRIAANGDTANKIGTYGVAVLAKAHGIPFYVAAPLSTFDTALPSGDGIPIEQRDPDEVTCGFGRRTAPEGADVYNPAFDVTPASLVAGIITEKGILKPPYEYSISRAFMH